ncbi:hypothetical protein SRHO_G00101680 [Serrasalmus rhombeus]
MSVSVLPEWKQLLLERKRREEEERERREREEEERLASMPAWKRGIIQRRRAKQEGGGERRESEREGGQHSCLDRNSDGPCDDRLMFRQTDNENETASKTHNQVSVETIGPIRQNPFIRSQNSYRRDNRRRETERENHGREKERESIYEKTGGDENTGEKEKDIEEEESQGQERDFWRGRDREMRIERTRDRSEGRERVGREVLKDREKDAVRGRREGERDGVCLPLVPGLRTIKAENIIIIEKDSKTSERDAQREKAERDGERASEEEEKKGMRMDLREFLATGGNVTEIRASEVLIIKPSIMEEKSGEGKKGEGERGNERKSSKENVMMSEKEKTKEGGIGKEKARDHDGEMKEAEAWPGSSPDLHKDSCQQEDSSLGSGRVSQILSKFGQHPKPPCRSKSTDSFTKPGKESSKARLSCGTEEERKEDIETMGFKGVPKRSFSFSERVVCVCEERKVVERTFSDRRLPPPVVIKNEQPQSVDIGIRRQGSAINEQQIVMQRKREIEGEMEEKRQRERVEGKEKERKEQGSMEANGGEVFSVASVRNPEGIAFARRIPIRQDRRELRFKEGNERERTMEKERMTEKEKEMETERQKMRNEVTEKGRQTEFHVEKKSESVTLRRDREEVTVVMESVKSLCSYTLDGNDWSNSHTVSDHKAVSTQYPAICSVSKSPPGTKMKGGDATTDFHKHDNQPEQTVLLQHTEELLDKTRRMQDARDNSLMEPRRESDVTGSKEKEREKSAIWHEQEENREMANTHIYRPALLKRAAEVETSTVKSPKHTSRLAGVGQQEIRIPRSVFFGVDELAEGCTQGPSIEDGQIGGGDKGKGVERRESWKAGRPLTRVESLRERIRQREMERQRRGEAEGEGERETGRSEGEGMERGEMRREAEGALRAVMVNRQEVASPQTLSMFDVTKEASVSKASPQLPASVPLSLSQSLSAGREAPKLSGNSQCFSEQNEEDFGSQRDPDSLTVAPPEEGETEEDLFEEEYICPSNSPSPPSSLSPTPSPPLPHSLAAMSRIYNLKTVGSRTAVCISERNSDVPTRSRKVFPEGRFTPLSHSVTQTSVCSQERATLGSDRMVRDGQAALTTETTAVQSVQRQVEQLQLREQEARHSSHGDGETQCGPKKEIGGKIAQGQKRPDAQTETQKPPTSTNSKASPSQQTGSQSKLPQPKLFTINTRNVHSPENLQKPLERAIATSSPLSPSSVSISPSLTPSPSQPSPLFSIRSASGGPGKRGTTITITPRRPAAGISASPAPSVSPSTPPTPAPEPDTGEGHKKRYPTAEEIEVIGGYQNLENSCLVKNRGTPKGEKVRFDESQLERVCEYPSEDSVLASLPGTEEERGSDGRKVEGESDGQEEEEEEELVGFVSGGSKSVGTSTGTARVLRVDESCRR